jgi:signal transduction histidine kinase
MKNKTFIAPPERSSSLDINLDNKLLSNVTYLLDILGAVSGITAILDENRQIVYANNDLLDLLGIKSIEPILGKRPGEAVACIHSGENEYGCGTALACSVCGAVNAILESQHTGQKTTKETRITSEIEGKKIAWDLRVSSAPIKINDRNFYVFTLQDISNDKRKQNLERLFFHDILNTAGNLNGLLSLLKDGADGEEAREIVNLSEEVSHDLLEEIKIQRQIRAAENGDLIVDLQLIKSIDILKSTVERIEGHEVANGKKIITSDNSADAFVETDRLLFQRVMINILKNALEATEKGGTISTGIEIFDDKVRFYVKNDQVMSNEIQLQIFQRSFSTKDAGRGIGTYSIKLISENYLNCKVGFISSEPEGTVFFVDLIRAQMVKE